MINIIGNFNLCDMMFTHAINVNIHLKLQTAVQGRPCYILQQDTGLANLLNIFFTCLVQRLQQNFPTKVGNGHWIWPEKPRMMDLFSYCLSELGLTRRT